MDVQPAATALDRSREDHFEPIFELGGPAFRLMQKIGMIRGSGPCILRRSVALAAITWVPMAVLAAWEGHAVDPTPRTSFLLDFATAFLVLPIAEVVRLLLRVIT